MRKRTHKISVWLDDEELKRLNDLVAKTRLNREQFIRSTLEGATILEAPPPPTIETIRQLRILGTEMGAIAHHSMFRYVSNEEQLRKVTDAVWTCLRQVMDTYVPFERRRKIN